MEKSTFGRVMRLNEGRDSLMTLWLSPGSTRPEFGFTVYDWGQEIGKRPQVVHKKAGDRDGRLELWS